MRATGFRPPARRAPRPRQSGGQLALFFAAAFLAGAFLAGAALAAGLAAGFAAGLAALRTAGLGAADFFTTDLDFGECGRTLPWLPA